MEIVKKHSATFPSDDADINLCKKKKKNQLFSLKLIKTDIIAS